MDHFLRLKKWHYGPMTEVNFLQMFLDKSGQYCLPPLGAKNDVIVDEEHLGRCVFIFHQYLHGYNDT
jgi:hypothetical protein